MLRNPLTMEIEAANNNVDVDTFRKQLISDNMADRAALSELMRQGDQATPLTLDEAQTEQARQLEENQAQVRALTDQLTNATTAAERTEINRQILPLLEEQKVLKQALAPQKATAQTVEPAPVVEPTPVEDINQAMQDELPPVEPSRSIDEKQDVPSATEMLNENLTATSGIDQINQGISIRLGKKYADLYAEPAIDDSTVDISEDDYQAITNYELTPAELEAKISAQPNKEQYAKDVKTVLAQTLGDLEETYRYEGTQDGKAIEDYIDSMLAVVQRYDVSQTGMPDQSSSAQVSAANEQVPDNRGVETQPDVATETIETKIAANDAEIERLLAEVKTIPDKAQKNAVYNKIQELIVANERMKAGVDDGPMFEVRENRVPGQGMQLSDIQAVYPDQDVFQAEDGRVSVRFKNGKSVTFQNIQDAGSGFIHFAISTGQMSKDGKILGVTIGNEVLLDKDFADRFTVWHENKHVLDNLGMITKEDNSVLTKEFNKLKNAGKLDFALSTHKDPVLAMQENLANTFAQVMTQRAAYRNQPLGTMIQRVMDFFKQLFAFGQQSLSGLAREVESGKIYERTVNGQTYQTMIPQAEVAANQWYSTVSKAIDSSNMQSAKGLAWLNQIKKYPNVKDDELEWTGLKDHLNEVGQDKISKEDLQAWFNDNQIQVEEVIKQDTPPEVKQMAKQKQDLQIKQDNIIIQANDLVSKFNYDLKYERALDEFVLKNPNKDNEWYVLSAFQEPLDPATVTTLKAYENQLALYSDQIADLETEMYTLRHSGNTEHSQYKSIGGEDYKEFTSGHEGLLDALRYLFVFLFYERDQVQVKKGVY